MGKTFTLSDIRDDGNRKTFSLTELSPEEISALNRKPQLPDAVVDESDPTKDASAFNLFQEGVLKRGGDILSLGTADQTEYDKYLMRRGPAQAGAVAADLAGFLGGGKILETMGMLPKVGRSLSLAGEAMTKPNTVVKAASAGGGYAAATTPGDWKERVKTGGAGAVGGMVLPLNIAAVKTAKALFDPLTEAGQSRIAGRTLEHFAGTDDVLAKLQNPEEFVRGSVPTVAEATQNPGLASLQNSLSHLSPEYASALKRRLEAQRDARTAAISKIAGDEQAMADAIKARDDATESLYDRVKQTVVSGDSTLDGLMQRPLVRSGMSEASEIAGNEGKPFVLTNAKPDQQVSTGVLGADGNPIMTMIPGSPAQYMGDALHNIKLGIDKAISKDGGKITSAQMKAKSDFVDWLEGKISEYGIAKSEFARLSRPINQMQIGEELLGKLRPALADYGSSRETAATFARALRDADKTAAKATGFHASKMKDVMTKEQMDVIEGVAKDLARKANADDLVRGVGSNTAKNLATQNLIRQALGPIGLPQSWSEAVIPQTLLKPLNMVYGGIAEPAVAKILGDGLLNPQLAAALMKRGSPGKVVGLLGDVLDYAPAIGIGAGINQ